ncbi:MAG TPA: ABC transporter substrate-binding protein [Dehalococcoidia bacterium]|nr:ABC transporter substrate-binding protein [Dehalococcoidia bacterium]
MRDMQRNGTTARPPSLSRRRLIRGTALTAAGLTLTGAACNTSRGPSASNKSGASGAPAQPKKGGVISYAGGAAGSYDTQGRTFDPMIQTQFGAKSYTLFYQRLLAYDLVSYKVQPELSQKWEQPSPAEYLFTLQPGVKWQNKPPVNGRPLTADDILYSLERARTNDPRFFSRSVLSTFDKIESPSPTSIRITTKGPDASTLIKLAVEELAILSHEAYEKFPKQATAEGAVGTGPFIITAMEENVSAEYVRNPDYWKPGLPYMDGFRTRAFPDTQATYAAFQGGQVDIAAVPGSASKDYIGKQGPGFEPKWFPNDDGTLLYPNTKVKPFDDARVTRALRLLIDHTEFKTAWSDVWFGRSRWGSLFPTAFVDWDLTEEEYSQHLEWKQPKDDAAKEALSLLSSAGFTRDKPLRFAVLFQANNQSITAGVQLLQAQWKRLSQGAVDAQLKPVDQQSINAARANGQFDYAFTGHTAGMVDADIWLSSTYRTGGSLNFGAFSDPTFDTMIDKQRAIFDDKQRKAAVKEVLLYAIDHVPILLPSGGYTLNAVRPRVQGYSPEHDLNGRQYEWIWMSS